MECLKRITFVASLVVGIPIFPEEDASQRILQEMSDMSKVEESVSIETPLNTQQPLPLEPAPLLQKTPDTEESSTAPEEMMYVEPLATSSISQDNNKGSTLRIFVITLGFVATATIGLILSSHNTGKRAH